MRVIGDGLSEDCRWLGGFAVIEAMLAALDVRTVQERKDHAVLLFPYNTGARADEPTG